MRGCRFSRPSLLVVGGSNRQETQPQGVESGSGGRIRQVHLGRHRHGEKVGPRACYVKMKEEIDTWLAHRVKAPTGWFCRDWHSGHRQVYVSCFHGNVFCGKERVPLSFSVATDGGRDLLRAKSHAMVKISHCRCLIRKRRCSLQTRLVARIRR